MSTSDDTANNARWIIVSQHRILSGALTLVVHFVFICGFGFLGLRTLPLAWHSLHTDFPNYYLVATLVREGHDTSRIYDWIWIQRQKNRFNIDQPIVGTAALTPFSFLAALPLTYLDPLTAKRVWTLINLALAVAVAIILKVVSRLRWHWIALVFLLCVPLHTNLVLGQMYVLLLLLMAIALWFYLRDKRVASGIFIGLAAGLKVFPVLFVLYFLRKRDWRATVGLFVGIISVGAITVVVFGRHLLWEYVSQQLVWAARGESLDAYKLSSNSLSSLLHRLFIYEPQLNPLPTLNAPWLAATLLPALQLLIFTPALLLANSCRQDERTLKLEWALFTLVILTISTFPASYHFTLLILPIILMLGVCFDERQLAHSYCIFFVFVATGLATLSKHASETWPPLFAVPRLYLLLILCLTGVALLGGIGEIHITRESLLWISVLVLGGGFSIRGSLLHQRGLFDDYRWRITPAMPTLLARGPVSNCSSRLLFIAMHGRNYSLTAVTTNIAQITSVDELSFSSTDSATIVEQSSKTSSLVWRSSNQPSIGNAHDPALASDGSVIAFIRDDHGRGQLWLKDFISKSDERRITTSDLNVLEVAVTPDHELVFSALTKGQPHLFASDLEGHSRILTETPTRYPAVSPDGRWLAFSQLERGVWNLWVADRRNHTSMRVTSAECNQITPSWESDSKTLLYSTDCGRGLLLTALARRRVIP